MRIVDDLLDGDPGRAAGSGSPAPPGWSPARPSAATRGASARRPRSTGRAACWPARGCTAGPARCTTCRCSGPRSSPAWSARRSRRWPHEPAPPPRGHRPAVRRRPRRRVRGLERRGRRGDRRGRAPRGGLGGARGRRGRPRRVLRLPGQPARASRWSTAPPGASPGRRPGSRSAGRPGATRDVVLVRGLEPNMRWRAFCEELLAITRELGVTHGRHAGRAARRQPAHPPGAGQRHRVRPASTPRPWASSAAGTRGRPASSGSSRTPARRPACRRCRSGRPCRTTCRSPRAPRRRSRCCAGSRTCSTSRCRSPTCPSRRAHVGAPGRRARRRGQRDRGVHLHARGPRARDRPAGGLRRGDRQGVRALPARAGATSRPSRRRTRPRAPRRASTGDVGRVGHDEGVADRPQPRQPGAGGGVAQLVQQHARGRRRRARCGPAARGRRRRAAPPAATARG